MRLSYAIKVPMIDRLKILWLGGLYFHLNYNGQHEISRITVVAIPSRDVPTGKVIRVDE